MFVGEPIKANFCQDFTQINSDLYQNFIQILCCLYTRVYIYNNNGITQLIIELLEQLKYGIQKNILLLNTNYCNCM